MTYFKVNHHKNYTYPHQPVRSMLENFLRGGCFQLPSDNTKDYGLRIYSGISVSINSFLLGFHLTIMAMFRDIMIESGVIESRFNNVFPIFLFGAFIGNFIPQFLRYNLKVHMFVVMSIVSIGHIIVGSSIKALTNSSINVDSGFYLVMFGRLLIGISAGNGCAINPQYLYNVAPDNLKGMFGFIHGTGIVLGVLMGQVMNWLVPIDFRVTIFQLFISINLLGFLMFIWIKNVQNIVLNTSKSVFELFNCKEARLSIFIAIFLHIGQQASGINPLCIFCDVILKKSEIFTPEAGTTMVGSVNVFFNFLGMFLVDKLGRKTLLLISMVFCILALVLLSQNFYSLVSLFIFFASFSIGLGPIVWFVPPEIFTEEYQSAGSVLSASFNWFFAGVFTFAHPFLSQNFNTIEKSVFMIYAFLLFIIMILTTVFYTETKKQTQGKFQKL